MKPDKPETGAGIAFRIGIVAAVLVILVALAGINRGWFDFLQPAPDRLAGRSDDDTARDQKPGDASSDKASVDKEGFVEIGGVLRPKSDLEAPENSSRPDAPTSLPKVGSTPLVDPDSSPQARSVAEAFKDPELHYRLSAMIAAPKFDREAYEKDPDSYLNEVAPGRIRDRLPAAADTPTIRRTSGFRTKVLQGESVVLRAETEPGMPVTFYSGRLGSFEGGLSTVTVRADEQGIAQAHFTATTGTYGEIDIVAASPVRSGLARFLVEVQLPDSQSSQSTSGENQ